MSVSGRQVFVVLVVAVVGAAVVGGLILSGSPAEERTRRLDARRLAHFKDIAGSIDIFWTRHARLPATLDELSAEADLSPKTRDPETSVIYEYLPAEAAAYELCAQFGLASEKSEATPRSDFWSYAAGRWCFKLEAREVERESDDAGR